MNLLQYLLPTDGFALIIVIILTVLFLGWLCLLLYSAEKIRIRKRRLASCSDVSDLRKVIAEEHTGRQAANTDPAKVYAAFDEFVDKVGLPKSDPVVMHVQSIYEAGCFETRLDVSELLRYTSQRLLPSNSLLRSLLGLFIVLGLLGTLAGLASSLLLFSQGFATGVDTASNENIRSSVSTMLQQLRGAFAPSVAGVSATVIGVLVFSLYLRIVCVPVQNMLDHLTLNDWVPQLIPTTPQRLVETLRRSEEQMRKSFRAAADVAEFAKEIQDEAGEFNRNLKTSNKALKQLSTTGDSLSSFSIKFEEGTERLVSFQDELRSLYKDSLNNSAVLRENVERSIKEAQQFQAPIFGALRNQTEQMQTINTGLKGYETAYLASRDKLDQALQKLLDSVNVVLSQIETRNIQLIERFGDPLIQKLHDKLSGLEEVLSRQLQAIVTQYQRMDTPLNDAAQKVSNALETIDRRTTLLKEELQRAFIQREEGAMKQLGVFNDLGSTISTLLKQMESNSQLQSRNLAALTESIAGLQGAIKSASDTEAKKKSEGGAGESVKEDRGLLKRIFGSR